MTTAVRLRPSELADALAAHGRATAERWQSALDGVGTQERVTWLLENAMPGPAARWTPDSLLLAHAGASLLEVGPYGPMRSEPPHT